MQVKKLEKNIWVVSDFISKKELNFLLADLASFTSSDWNAFVGLDSDSFWVNRAADYQTFSSASQQIINAISDRVFSCFENYKEILQVGNVNRTLSDGRSMEYHVDNAEPPDYDNMFGLVLYVNDDYKGGKIHYKDLDIEYQPKAGDLVVHYAGYWHGVTEVTEGVRYIFTSFVRGTKDTLFLGEKLGI